MNNSIYLGQAKPSRGERQPYSNYYAIASIPYLGILLLLVCLDPDHSVPKLWSSSFLFRSSSTGSKWSSTASTARTTRASSATASSSVCIHTCSCSHARQSNQSHKHKSTNNLYLSSYLLDLDDTLYPFNSGIAADIMKNIQGTLHTSASASPYYLSQSIFPPCVTRGQSLLLMLMRVCSSDYMVHKLGVEESISLELCVLLYKQYGTTMAGLRVRALQSQNKTISFHCFCFCFFPVASWPYNTN